MKLILNRELTEDEKRKQEEYSQKYIKLWQQKIKDLERINSEIKKIIPGGFDHNPIRREIEKIIKGLEEEIKDLQAGIL